MKNLLKTFCLFIALSVIISIFSIFSACSSSTSSQKGPVDEKTAGETKTISENNSSEYPTAPAAVLNSDIKSIDGNIFKVADLKGKVLLLNMWATWCGPCREEMPQLVAMETDHKDKDFKVIGLNIDNETPEQIKPFAEKMKLNYELAWADESLYRALLKVSKFDGIPQSYLIDREGRLRGVFLGGSQKTIRQMRENVEKVVNE